MRSIGKLGVIFSAAAVVAGMTGGVAQARPASVRPLAGSTAPFVTARPAIGSVPGSQQLSIQLWLRPRTAAAGQFAGAASTPGNALFHHYLRPDAYTARFGATSGQAAAVESWLRAQGFTAVHADSQRSYVRATARTSTIDAAFHTQLKLYRASATVNAGHYPLRANDRAISLPSALAGRVIGVTGLDNAAPVLPLARPGGKAQLGHPAARRAAPAPAPPCSQYYGQHVQPGLPKRFGTTKFPTEVCGYTARQLRAFYGATPAHNGQGQKIALVELGLNSLMFDTLKDYAKASHIAAPSSQRYSELSLGQGSKCGDPFDGEEQLDVEAAYDMVPAASELVVGGDSCNEGDFGLQGLFDADTAIVDGVGNHPLATVASNSWESADESQPASLTNIEHAYLVRAAAEGVGMYFSTGDVGFLEAPSTDPDAIAVGGTTLGIGKANNRVFETGWSTGQFLLNKKHQWVTQVLAGAAGGGASLLWAQPHYQAGVVPPALSAAPGDRGGQVRSAPDISALADPDTGFLMGLLEPGPGSHPPIFFLSDIGGTSLAAPLVAGLVTAAQQGQPAPFGLINPALYQLAGTSAIHDVLPLTSSSPVAWRAIACGPDTCGAQALDQFDDQSTSMPGYAGLVTLPGYDNMTGIGTPNGQQFITALRALAG